MLCSHFAIAELLIQSACVSVLLNRMHPGSFRDPTGKMSIMSQNQKMSLFVNNSQIQKYGCSPAAPVTDKTAHNLNIFRSFSTLQDTYTNQSTTASVNDIEYNYKPDSTAGVSNLASPVFGVQKQMTTLSNNQNLMIADSPVIAVWSCKCRLGTLSLFRPTAEP